MYKEYFADLESAISRISDFQRLYRRYRQIFYRLIDENTAQVNVVFRGPYPKTDYLLKEKDAHWLVRKHVHDARVRLRRAAELSEEKLAENHLNDLQGLCEFIALIYGVPIPQALARLFPKDEKRNAIRYSSFTDCVRMIVYSWDEDYFYGKMEQEETEEEIRVAFQSERSDWSYLKELFSPDCQVNLVRPSWSEKGTEISAELIIFEPDYLIDISGIAACFEQYADDPDIALLKKIKPNKPSAATILGNLVSEVLDQTLHPEDGGVDLRDISHRFMERNALAMSTLTTAELTRLWGDTQQQATNIARALGSGLAGAIGTAYQPDKVMVEATFFAEMLGIQGRMDFFQTDGLVVLEQKSGKGAYPYGNFQTPIATEQHIVQLNLYVSILRYAFRSMYTGHGRNVHSFLLYSKYRDSLYSQGYNSGELLLHAIEIRNRIAWNEMQYAVGDGFRRLDSLTAEVMNRKGAAGPLWERYQKADIDALLSPIHCASPLERAYFYRMLKFVANEHLPTKIGNKTKENSGFASKWYDSLEDKLHAGNIYASLRMEEPGRNSATSVETLRFRFRETEANDIANFRPGDIVMAYPYYEDTEPDVRRTMVFRCSIESIEADSISLRLRAPQSSAYVFLKDKERPWAIEHDFYESSFSGLYRGVYAFLLAPLERRQLLLLQRKPQADSSITQLRSSVPEDFRPMALRVKQAKDLFLIIGPPGTGKTSIGLMTTVREQLSEPGSSILLMSYTNRAVDEICEKLMEDDIDFIRIGNPLSASPESRPHLLSERVRSLPHIGDMVNTIRQTRVFVGTTASLSSQLSLFQQKQFDLAIIDEASQILEPHLLPLLSATWNGLPVIRKIVMIGDHKQLPAVVQQTADVSKVQEPLLRDIGLTDCSHSLFERFLLRYGNDEQTTFMLTRQGRMHPDIAEFPNRAFYGNRLELVPLAHQQRSLPQHTDSADALDHLLATQRVSFIAVDPPRDSVSDKVNQAEADVIAALAQRIYRMYNENPVFGGTFHPCETLGIIVPYRNQIATVRNTLLRTGIPELAEVTIDTVERYQGSQRKFIIYGFTIQHRYQLGFLTNNVFTDTDGSIVDRKLNVAMTRAQESLILVGNPSLLSCNAIFSHLISFVRTKHGYWEILKEFSCKREQESSLPELCLVQPKIGEAIEEYHPDGKS